MPNAIQIILPEEEISIQMLIGSGLIVDNLIENIIVKMI